MSLEVRKRHPLQQINKLSWDWIKALTPITWGSLLKGARDILSEVRLNLVLSDSITIGPSSIEQVPCVYVKNKPWLSLDKVILPTFSPLLLMKQGKQPTKTMLRRRITNTDRAKQALKGIRINDI